MTGLPWEWESVGFPWVFPYGLGMGMTLSLWVFPHVGSVGFCGFSWGMPNFRDGTEPSGT